MSKASRSFPSEQAILAHLGRQLAGETRLESFLSIVSEEIQTLLGARHCRIFMDPKGHRTLGTPSANGSRRVPAALAEKVRRAVRAGTCIRVDAGRGGVSSLLAAPMVGHDGKVLGYIEVADKRRGRFNDGDEGFLMLLASVAGYALDNEKLNHDLEDSHLETIYRLATVTEFRDKEDLSGHLRRMSRYSAMIAQGMGLQRGVVKQILYASPLHDIGKIAIPDSVLRKPAKLNSREYEIMKQHTVLGAQILAHAKNALLKMASKIALAHHEKYDGTGYPRGLEGRSIPQEARIVSVADVFDALASRRVYKASWGPQKAREYILERAGKDFDPRVVEAFEKAYPRIEGVMSQKWPDWGQRLSLPH